MIVIKHSLFTPLRTTLGGKSSENIFCHVNHQIWADINSLNFAQLHFRMFFFTDWFSHVSFASDDYPFGYTMTSSQFFALVLNLPHSLIIKQNQQA